MLILYAIPVDTPDPYIKVDVKNAPNGKKQTKAIDNKKDPVWNETFNFYLKENAEGNEMGIFILCLVVVA